MKNYSLQLLKLNLKSFKKKLKHEKKLLKILSNPKLFNNKMHTKSTQASIELHETIIADLEIAIDILDNSKSYDTK